MKTYQTLLFAFAIFAAFAEGQPFDRYQTIIDRKPFGPEPANFNPEAVPGTASAAGAAGEMTPEQRTAEEQNLAAKVRVSILNFAPDGAVKVGFTDSSANPPENYYLKVGGSQNGWTVKDAEPASESVTLEKDGVEVTLKLGEGSGGKGGTKEAVKGGRTWRAPIPLAGNREGNGSGAGVAPPPAQTGGLLHLRQKAKQKREADAAAKAEQAEREAREQEERQRQAAESAQQREQELQQFREQMRRDFQEQLRKDREERQAAQQTQQEAPE